MIPQLYITKTITGTIINPKGFDTTSMGRGSVTHGVVHFPWQTSLSLI